MTARRRRPRGATGVALLAAGAAAVLATGCAGGGETAAEPASSAAVTTGPATAALVAAAGLRPCPPPGRPGSTGTAARLPDLTLACLGSGPPVSLARLAGPAVVNMWASWCAPCRREMPALQQVQARAGGRLLVLGVVTDDDRRSALSAAAALGVRYPSVLDGSGRLRRALGYPGPPVTLLVDGSGRIATRIVGPVPSAAALTASIRRHLGVAL